MTGEPVAARRGHADLLDRFDADAADQRAPLRRRQDRAGLRHRRLRARLLGQVQLDRRRPHRRLLRPGPGRLPAVVRLHGRRPMMRRIALAVALACLRRGLRLQRPEPPRARRRRGSHATRRRASPSIIPAAWTRDTPAEGQIEFYGTPGEGGLPPQVVIGDAPARNDLRDVVKLHKGMQKVRFTDLRRDPRRAGRARRRRGRARRRRPVHDGLRRAPRCSCARSTCSSQTEDGRQLDFFVRSPAGDYSAAKLDDRLRLLPLCNDTLVPARPARGGGGRSSCSPSSPPRSPTPPPRRVEQADNGLARAVRARRPARRLPRRPPRRGGAGRGRPLRRRDRRARRRSRCCSRSRPTARDAAGRGPCSSPSPAPRRSARTPASGWRRLSAAADGAGRSRR